MSLPAVSEIESGTSILFLGAGFSAEATNVNDEPIKDVLALIKLLLSAVGISSAEDYDLDTAAEEYHSVYGDAATARALHSNFRSKLVTDAQRTVVCQPWYRIYTTNYDDVVERICVEEKKPYTTKEIGDPVSPPMPDTTQLIHIYGNITRSSETEFKRHFLLTERQRDNSPFIKSAWMRRFHDDVLSAQSIVFVGFSLSDIDLRRLLGLLPADTLRKVHFITRAGTKRPILSRMGRFGTPHQVGLDGFAQHLGPKRNGPGVKQYLSVPASLQELNFSQQLSSNVSSNEIEHLLISGDADIAKFAQADIEGHPGSYTISRSANAYQRANQNAAGNRPILIHSDIGNGKTVFSLQIGYMYSQKKHRVFRLQREPENTGDIIGFLQAIESPALVILDDVLRFPTIASAIMAIGRSDIVILATVRSGALETAPDRVKSRLGGATFIEIDLNISQRDESQRVVSYLNENGLLGDYAELSEAEKLAFVEKTCRGQLRDVVLSLYQTGALHARVEQLLVNIQRLDKSPRDLIILSALLTYAGYQEMSQLLVLSDLVEYGGAYEELRQVLVEHELNSLVRIDAADLTIRSPALAEFILKRVFNVEVILEIARGALHVLDKYYLGDSDFEHLAKGLLKFSLYGRLIKSDAEISKVENFYDKCRVLSFAHNDPLFWVQRSICNMKRDDHFDISFRFVETAYGIARKRTNFDTYQIDNHHARLLLMQSKVDGVSPDGEREKQAQSLLSSVLARKSDDLYHPLSVMRLYAEIVDEWGGRLSTKQKNALKKVIDKAIASIAAFKHLDRFRNLNDLRTRLASASRRLT